MDEDETGDADDMEAAARALDSVDGPSSYSMGPPPPPRKAKPEVEQKEAESETETDDRLSLTLQEIVHIRSVMTKAELEGLPIEVRIKEDVEKRKVRFGYGFCFLGAAFCYCFVFGKLVFINAICPLFHFVQVCFLCLKTRFSIFGQWGVQCKLCQKTVCAKCYTKVRIIVV